MSSSLEEAQNNLASMSEIIASLQGRIEELESKHVETPEPDDEEIIDPEQGSEPEPENPETNE